MNLAIIGSGLLGTSTAQCISKNQSIENITIYGRNEKVVEQINKYHENKSCFPGIKLNEKIHASKLNFEEAVKADLILIAIPSHAIKSVLEELKKYYKNTPIITTNKGMETVPPYRFSHQIVREILGRNAPFLYLYTRAFAKSIISGEITKNALASDNSNLLNWVKDKFENERYKIQVTDDIIGLEVAGIMKNITAIANGLAERLGFSKTTQSYIIDEGIKEWILLSEKLRGSKKDPNEIALGDFWMSSNEDSRNYKFGLYFPSNDFSKSRIFSILNKLKTRKYNPLLKEAKSIYEEIIVDGISGFVNDVLMSPVLLANLFSKSPYIETLEGSYSIPSLMKVIENLKLNLPLIEGIYKIYFVGGIKSEKESRKIINEIISNQKI